MHRSVRTTLFRVAVSVTALLLIPQTANAAAGAESTYVFATPLFGLSAARGGGLLVADAGAGVVKLRGGNGTLIAELPNITDVAPYTKRSMHAVTGAGDARLYRIRDGLVTRRANLGRFEANVNPDGGEIDSNPFDVATLPHGRALVADAAANALLFVRKDGHIDWVATLPSELVSTDNAKALVGCPYAEPENQEICDLPDMIPAQPVATSVAVGPDGAYYVGELKGFPAPTGESKVWRIEPGTRHAECGTSPACSVVADGFTSVIDLGFGRDGALHVVEFDEASWFAVELGQPTGGTVNACDVTSGDCQVVAGGLFMPTAVASTRQHVFVTSASLVPGEADVVKIA